MIPTPTRATSTDTHFPYTTLFRSRLKLNVKMRHCYTSGKSSSSRRAKSSRNGNRIWFLKILICCESKFKKNSKSPTCKKYRRYQRRLSRGASRTEEHTYELQSLIRISYDVICLKKKTKHNKK